MPKRREISLFASPSSNNPMISRSRGMRWICTSPSSCVAASAATRRRRLAAIRGGAGQTKLRLALNNLRESLAVETNVGDDKDAYHKMRVKSANSTMRALATGGQQKCDLRHVTARAFLRHDRAFLRHAAVLG